MTSKSKLRAFGEVYNVRERMSEENGISGEWDDYPDWYEYQMFLLDEDGDIVDEWDSLVETYNGVQRLSEDTARKSVQEVVDDVKAGKAASWFNRVPERYIVKAKPKAKRKSRSKSGSALGMTRLSR